MSKKLAWVKYLLAGIFFLIILGLGYNEYKHSQVAGHAKYRFNLAMIGIESGLTFVSYDPAEKSILAIPFPNNLAIHSRTSGEYSVSSLYKLGAYKGQGGMFARQKIQGFMRVPVPGYIVTKSNKGSIKSQLTKALLKVIWGQSETSLSRIDALLMLARTSGYSLREVKEDELVRSGVISNNTYYPDRLQEYVGSRLFDWGIGATGITAAIINASGENGLGSDMADFLSNLGLDVVMVRSASETEALETTEWQVNDDDSAEKLRYVFENLFGLSSPKIEAVPGEFRAEVLIRVGKDAKELF